MGYFIFAPEIRGGRDKDFAEGSFGLIVMNTTI
jgi:hypothetical protein